MVGKRQMVGKKTVGVVASGQDVAILNGDHAEPVMDAGKQYSWRTLSSSSSSSSSSYSPAAESSHILTRLAGGMVLAGSVLVLNAYTAHAISGGGGMGTSLSFKDFSGQDLKRKNFNKADMRGINLTGADLEGSSLFGAILAEAQLEKANLRYADLELADMEGANLKDAVLEGAMVSCFMSVVCMYTTPVVCICVHGMPLRCGNNSWLLFFDMFYDTSAVDKCTSKESKVH